VKVFDILIHPVQTKAPTILTTIHCKRIVYRTRRKVELRVLRNETTKKLNNNVAKNIMSVGSKEIQV